MDSQEITNVSISVNCPSWNEEQCAKILSMFQELSQRIIDADLWPSRIAQVIVSEDYVGEFLRQRPSDAETISHDKESIGISKIVYPKTGGVLLIAGGIVNPDTPETQVLEGIFFTQVLTVTFTPEWRNTLNNSKGINDSITWWVMNLLGVWLPELEAIETSMSLGVIPHSSYAKKIYLDEFKRRVKKAHMVYQVTRVSVDPLIQSFMDSLSTFVLRALEGYVRGEKLDDLEEFSKPVLEIIDSIQAILDHKPRVSNRYIAILRRAFAEILDLCFLRISEKEEGSHVAVTADPRLLFKDNFIETVPAIVGFTDILGFSKNIQHYDSTPTSNSLKELREALSLSVSRAKNALTMIEMVMEAITSITEQKYLKHSNLLEYRQFSDCLSLALPILDFPPQFLHEMMSVCLTLSTYQFELMTRGWFIRGGISVGSYYTDPNMIFSGALIDSYELEHRVALYPRIVVSNDVAERLKNCDRALVPALNIQKLFLFSDAEPNLVFLNPLFVHCSPVLNPLQTVSIEPILLALKDRIAEFSSPANPDEEKIQQKYWWFADFVLWYLGEESQNQFRYLFDQEDSITISPVPPSYPPQPHV
jgi:hypothetical protein